MPQGGPGAGATTTAGVAAPAGGSSSEGDPTGGPFARGRFVFPLIAFVLSGIIALPTVALAYRASGGDHTTTIGILALVGLGIAGTGAVLRACAHNRGEIGWVDHLGKLFAVGAFSSLFWDELLLVGHDTWGDGAAVLALGVLGCVAVVLSARMVRARRGAPPSPRHRGGARGGFSPSR